MSDDGYVVALKLLARRELSEAQIRARLSKRGIESAEIDEAVNRLRRERALDDRRAALACARTEARVRQRGRARIVRQIESMGIARDIARAAVAEVFSEVDERSLLEQALDKRLRRGATLSDTAAQRRIHRHLIAQGFEPSRVAAAIQSRLGSGPDRRDRGQSPEIES